jgi:AP-2 complex subunit mu-1
VLDYGYPQNCSLDVLKMYINLGSQRVATTAQEDRKMTSTITGARDWRREGIVHKTNEVFLDVLESVNLLLSTTGTVLRNDVTGKVGLHGSVAAAEWCCSSCACVRRLHGAVESPSDSPTHARSACRW